MKPCNSKHSLEQCNAKQSDILNAAIVEFAKCGVMGTTMEQIAKSGQVSKRTLYKNYASKCDLFDDVVDLLLSTIHDLNKYQYQADVPILEQLKHLAHEAVKRTKCEDYVTLSRIVIIESMRSKEAADRVDSKFQSCEKGMTDWFKTAEAAGVLGSLSAKTASTMFYGSLKQLTYWEPVIKWKPSLSDEELEVVIEQVCQVFSIGLTQFSTQTD
jgi:TetR/AcrR family transcriptional regulator of autoinduction and epiphytic fitness